MTNTGLLPQGKHWGLTIEHRFLEDSGDFVPHAGAKLVWHTTEGPTIEGAYATLKANRDAPNVIIDPSNGHVIQTAPLNHASRALEHPQGTPETNRAGCRQVEIVGYTHDCPHWPNPFYEHLASLAVLIEHRVLVPRHAPESFAHPRKINADEFLGVRGHIGHVHVPNNSHVDPTGFLIDRLFTFMGQRH